MANKHLKTKQASKPEKHAARTGSHTAKDTAPLTPTDAPTTAYKPVSFRSEPTAEQRAHTAARRKNAIALLLTSTGLIILLAAAVLIWYFRDSFEDDTFVLSFGTTAVAQAEWLFDSGSGQVFAPVGSGLAVATSSGLELLDAEGSNVASKLLQMENPAIASCDSFAVFYDIGGTNLAVADLQGNVTELELSGEIFSVTVSDGGYIAAATRCTGYRALVTVYNPLLDPVYNWYSSSAWVMSAAVSPDNRRLAVLSYTAAGSEVRFFDLTSTDQKSAFSVSDTILLDMHWFSSARLCAYSSDQAFFFADDGRWTGTYSFSDQFITGYADGGSGFVVFALSPYQAGSSSTLISLDPGGNVLGTALADAQIVSLTARSDQVIVLCPDGVYLFSDSMTEKGYLAGLPGFKYALLQDRSTALLIAANYAEVYKF